MDIYVQKYSNTKLGSPFKDYSLYNSKHVLFCSNVPNGHVFQSFITYFMCRVYSKVMLFALLEDHVMNLPNVNNIHVPRYNTNDKIR